MALLTHQRIIGTLALCLALSGTAECAEPTNKQAALQDIARKFVKKLDPFYAKQKLSPEQRKLSAVPDDTTLLLRPRVDQLQYNDEIYSIKKNDRLYLSWVDFIDILELAIDYDEDTGIGRGWFIREDWPFRIDFNERTVASRGRVFNLSPQDTLNEDGILFVSGDAISTWMDFAFDYDVAQQYVAIETPYPLPAVARDIRRNRKSDRDRFYNNPVLPRVDEDESLLDVNVVNVNTGLRYAKTQGGTTNTRNFTNVAVDGQFLNHESYIFANRDSQQGLRNVTSRFARRSEMPDLLGPLNARAYEFGDVNSTELPLTGDARASLGINIDNNPLSNADFNVTDITGFGDPNFDVELYRDGVLIDSLTIGDDGQYEFSDVSLFAGNNGFELYFYGPQGQVTTETLNIPVNAALLRTQKDTYEVSVNLEDRRTYEKFPDPDPDRGQPHIAARYNKYLGNSLGYLGVRSRSIADDRRNFLSTGLTGIVGNTIIDTNAAIDHEANTAFGIGARRNVGDWRMSLNGQWNTDEYMTEDTADPTVLNLNADIRKNYKTPFNTRGTVFANTAYNEIASGGNNTVTRLGVSNQIDRVNLSNVLTWDKPDGFAVAQDERLNNTFTARGIFGKAFLRAGVNYEILPKSEIENIFSQFNYRLSPQNRLDLQLSHDPSRDFSRGRLNLSHTNKYFRTSPFVEVNSNDSVFAGVNLDFNLLDVPGQVLPEITSKRLIGTGTVNGFVYHDKNGNLIFDGDDEVLPEAIVESVNSKRRATVNEKGYAVLSGMPVTRPTDIIVDESSLPDSFMVAAREGVSVFPSAGEKYDLEFPVHLAGEIDGTIYIQDKFGNKKPGGRLVMELLPLDLKNRDVFEAETAFDGFYLFSKIPPGEYLLNVKETRGARGLGNPKPVPIKIGYDGTVIGNQDIIMRKNFGFVPYRIVYSDDNTEPLAEIPFQLVLREHSGSELAQTLRALLMKTNGSRVLKGLETIESNGETIYYSNNHDINDLHNRCQSLKTYKIACELRIFGAQTNPVALASNVQNQK